MKKTEKNRIINSLLDIDYYKLSMAQLAFLRFREAQSVFAFKNRTKSVRIADCVDEKELRAEMDHVRKIKGITDEEADYLKSLKIFGQDFIDFLKNLTLPEYSVENDAGDFIIQFKGKWPEATLWETICLSILSELYNRSLLSGMTEKEKEAVFKEGDRRLGEKIKILKRHPEAIIIEFGTRRRFSRDWQDRVLGRLVEEIPGQLFGTSNVLLAMKYGLPPVGTFAHEMDMMYSGIFHEDIKGSHNKVLRHWWDRYGFDLSIALTDTYGSDFFFKDMTKEQAKKWKGLRHDSGDPIEFGEKAIKFYEEHGIDPKEKLLVFSDGLDIDKIIAITEHFKGRIKFVFGWGTNLTNDLGLKPLSLVVKVVEANGHGTVKLSDNLAKAIGKPEDIEKFKEIFGHEVTLNETCVY